jgi:hypothetical protein
MNGFCFWLGTVLMALPGIVVVGALIWFLAAAIFLLG